MSNVKISELPEIATLSSTAIVPVVQGGITEKTSAGAFITQAAGYTQSGSGTIAQTVQARLRLEVWAEDFGAVGDGVTDDTISIQAAINYLATRGGRLLFAAKDYLVTSLVLKTGVYLIGKGGGVWAAGGTVLVTRLVGTAGSDIITFLDTSVTNVGLLGMKMKGGRRGIYYEPTGGTAALSNIILNDITFDTPSAECIYIGGQSERQFFKYIYFANGTYGYYHGKGNRAVFGIFEKSTWEHLYFQTQSKSSVFWDTIANSGSSVFNFVKIIGSGEHGMRIKGNFGGMTFIDWIGEDNGTTGKNATTTGTITSGTNSLVVASATGFAISDPITVSGALAFGEDLTTTISNIVGTTFTLGSNAGTSVAAAATTNRSYDDISLESVGGLGNAYGLVLINSFPGSGNNNNHIRYGLNNTAGWCTSVTVIGGGGDANAPIYDPRRKVCLINAPIGLRVATAFDRYEMSSLHPTGSAGLDSSGTLIGSYRGKGITMGLPDSNLNGTGTLGNFSTFASYASTTEIFRIEGTLPTDGKTCAYVFRNVGGAFSLQQITMGAADSGGAGFKLLRVPN